MYLFHLVVFSSLSHSLDVGSIPAENTFFFKINLFLFFYFIFFDSIKLPENEDQDLSASMDSLSFAGKDSGGAGSIGMLGERKGGVREGSGRWQEGVREE